MRNGPKNIYTRVGVLDRSVREALSFISCPPSARLAKMRHDRNKLALYTRVCSLGPQCLREAVSLMLSAQRQGVESAKRPE
jgi:hypothetical protein